MKRLVNVPDQMDEEAERGRLLGTQGRIHYGLCIRALLIDTLDELVQLQDDIVLLLSILCLRTILLLSTKRKI